MRWAVGLGSEVLAGGDSLPDVQDVPPQLSIGVKLAGDACTAVQDGGVVTASEEPADRRKTEVRLLLEQVHRDMACAGYVLLAPGTAQHARFNVEVVRYRLQ